MRALLTLCCALAVVPSQSSAIEPSDATVSVIAREYWSARLLWRYATNRSCAIKGFPRYQDPESPIRRNDERMRRIEKLLKSHDPEVISRNRPRQPFPPSYSQCDDEALAREALVNYDAKIALIETLLGLVDLEKQEEG